MKVSIYALLDPRTDEVRYVGKTSRALGARLSNHVSECDHIRNHRTNWVRVLKRLGLRPVIVLLEEVPVGQWEDAEIRWIAQYRVEGARLLNTMDGGQPGHARHGSLSEETRAKISATMKSKPLSPLHAAALAKGQRSRRPKSEQHRRKLAEIARATWASVSPEERSRRMREVASTPRIKRQEAIERDARAVRLYAGGMTYPEVASAMGISSATVWNAVAASSVPSRRHGPRSKVEVSK